MADQVSSGSSNNPPNSNMAVVSLIAGILGVTLFPFIGCIVAVITGPMAKKEIAESQGRLGGEGLATAGMVLGWIGIGLSVIGICVGLSMFAVPFCIGLFAVASENASLLQALLLAI